MRKPSKKPGPLSSKSNYRCTASNCKRPITSSYEANFHPLLDCLICRRCYLSYGNGDFASMWDDGVDSSNDDNYCRWCIDGGDLFVCMNEDSDKTRCHYSFCKECIKLNVPNDPILTADELESGNKWHCFACDKTKLKSLRKFTQAAMKDLQERDFKVETKAKRPKTTTTEKENDKDLEESELRPEVETKRQKLADPEKGDQKDSEERNTRTEAGAEAKRPKAAEKIDAEQKSPEERNSKGVEAESQAKRLKVADLVDVDQGSHEDKNPKAKPEAKRLNVSDLKEGDQRGLEEKNLQAKSEAKRRSVSSLKVGDQKGLEDKNTKSVVEPKRLSVSGLKEGSQKSLEDKNTKSVVETKRLTVSDLKGGDQKSLQERNLGTQAETEAKRLKESNPEKENEKANNLQTAEIARRLQAFKKTKNFCIDEINSKFDVVCDIFTSPVLTDEQKLKQTQSRIDTLQEVIKEFTLMLSSMRTLSI